MAAVYPRQTLLLLLIFTTLISSLVESFAVMSYTTSKPTKISSTTGDVDVLDDAMTQTYDKLATRLINRYQKDLSSNKLLNNQLFVCVAGGPGSGKSTCETICLTSLVLLHSYNILTYLILSVSCSSTTNK